MNTAQSYSIKETRIQLSRLIDEVSITNRQFIITKFGKPKAMLIPIKADEGKSPISGLEAGFGIWADRKDIKNSAKWVAKLRHRMSNRYGKISG